MQTTLTRFFIMLTRLSGLIAILLGACHWAMSAGYWDGFEIPLPLHMCFGLLVVVGLWGLAVQACRLSAGLTVLGLLLGVIVPVVGIAQLFVPVYLQMEEAQTAMRALHLLIGLGTIGFAEMLAARLKKTRA